MLLIIVCLNIFGDVSSFGQRPPFEDGKNMEEYEFGFMNGPYHPSTPSSRLGFGWLPAQNAFPYKNMFSGKAPSPSALRTQPSALRTQGEPQNQALLMPDQNEVDRGDAVDDDTYHLNFLAQRLTDTNKWGEFYDLIDEEKEKHNGHVMKDYEKDIHKWAMYSRDLLKTKKTESKTPRIDAMIQEKLGIPSVGMEAYWNRKEDTEPSDPGMGPGMPSMGQSIPGMGPGMPNMGQSLPGMQPGMPSMGQSLLGMQPGMPSMGQSLPGMQTGMPSMGRSFAGMGSGMPSMGQSFPGLQPNIPSMGQSFPGLQPNMPSMGRSFPGMGPSMPNMGQSFPGMEPGKPSQSLQAITPTVPNMGNPQVMNSILRSGPEAQQVETPIPGGSSPRSMLLEMALKKLAILEQKEKGPNITIMKKSPKFAGLIPTAPLPQFDDFKAPIKWVPFNSPDTEDGLAQVTDPKTRKNLQFTINGTTFVPVIDTNLERLGWTNSPPTTPRLPPVTTDNISLRVVINTVDLNKVDEKDWLAFEVVMGSKNYERTCNGDGCQSRCHRLGCETMCNGDTCVTGCVGTSCSAYCRGPGCMAMCIGDYCTTKCEGLNCESRCRGKECDASCKMFSCQTTANGVYRQTKVPWDQMYPQYDAEHAPMPQDLDDRY